MKRLFHSSALLLAVCSLLLAPRVAGAQAYTVEPDHGYFGDVEIGSSRSLVLRITSVGINPVVIGGLELTWSEASPPPRCGLEVECDFSITAIHWDYLGESHDSLPAFLPTGEALEVEVTFAPTSMGDYYGEHFAFLQVMSDADYSTEFIPLYGRSVEASPEPVMLGDLIAFFNQSVADGSLVGSGPGNSAHGRLKALGNMLMAASDLIEAGECVAGRLQLEDVLARTDGAERPQDFVAGTARDTLAAMIRDVLGALVCS